MLKQASWLLALSAAAVVQVKSAAPVLAAYSAKPVEIILPYPPGGSTDVFIRTVAQYLEPELGQPIVIVIVNMKGADGAAGMLEAVTSRPDGYTVRMYLTNTDVAQAVGVAAFTNDDFDPACHVGDIFLTLTAKGAGPYETLDDYRKAAEANPGEVGLAMGVGSLAQFAAGMVADEMGVELRQVNAGMGQPEIGGLAQQVDDDFHHGVVGSLRNPIIDEAYRQTRDRVALIRLDQCYEFPPPLIRTTMQEHGRIMAALVRHDRDDAAAAMDDHLIRSMHRAMGI